MTTATDPPSDPPTDPATDTAPARSLPGWASWLPTIALVVAFGVKAIASPNAVRDVFNSTQAFVITAVLIAGWILLAFVLLPRLIRSDRLRLGVLSAVAVVGVVLLVVPSFRNTEVIEAFPTVTAPPASVGDPEPAVEPVAEPTEPVRLGTAPLAGIDHDATGTATISRQPDGSYVVGLEEIEIEPGPDYFVYVVSGRDRQEPGNGVRLDALKGNQGTQFYPVPTGPDLASGDWTVLVWCRAFAVPIANATPVT